MTAETANTERTRFVSWWSERAIALVEFVEERRRLAAPPDRVGAVLSRLDRVSATPSQAPPSPRQRMSRALLVRHRAALPEEDCFADWPSDLDPASVRATRERTVEHALERSEDPFTTRSGPPTSARLSIDDEDRSRLIAVGSAGTAEIEHVRRIHRSSAADSLLSYGLAFEVCPVDARRAGIVASAHRDGEGPFTWRDNPSSMSWNGLGLAILVHLPTQAWRYRHERSIHSLWIDIGRAAHPLAVAATEEFGAVEIVHTTATGAGLVDALGLPPDEWLAPVVIDVTRSIR